MLKEKIWSGWYTYRFQIFRTSKVLHVSWIIVNRHNSTEEEIKERIALGNKAYYADKIIHL
jgi:hypothetical protein